MLHDVTYTSQEMFNTYTYNICIYIHIDLRYTVYVCIYIYIGVDPSFQTRIKTRFAAPSSSPPVSPLGRWQNHVGSVDNQRCAGQPAANGKGQFEWVKHAQKIREFVIF